MKKKLFILFSTVCTSFFVYSQQVGINNKNPRTTLDVNGTFAVSEVIYTISSASDLSIPVSSSQIRFIKGVGVGVGVTDYVYGLKSGEGVVGERITLINDTDITATGSTIMSSVKILPGKSQDFIFTELSGVKKWIAASLNVEDATTTVKGIVKLAGDLAGTADTPLLAANGANNNGQLLKWNGTKWEAANNSNGSILIPSVNGTAAQSSPVNGMMMYDTAERCIKAYVNNVWTTCIGSTAYQAFSLSQGTVPTLNTNNSTLGKTFTVNYSNNNTVGTTYAAQTLTSVGVTGLTATLSAGTLSTNNGTLIYSISGMPTFAGNAIFTTDPIQGAVTTVNVPVILFPNRFSVKII